MRLLAMLLPKGEIVVIGSGAVADEVAYGGGKGHVVQRCYLGGWECLLVRT